MNCNASKIIGRLIGTGVLASAFLSAGCTNSPAERPSSSSTRPNVLWIMSDEQRTDSLGCYGSSWARTPNLDRLGREGVIFTNAITPAPVCVPARASILSGKYPSQLNLWNNVPPGDGYTYHHLTEPFHHAGYQSASFGKQHYGASNKPFQTQVEAVLSEAVHYFRYAEQYDPNEYDIVQYPPNPYPWILGGRFPEPAANKSEARVVREAIAWLEAHDSSIPFFLRASFNAPHTPVVPPEPYDTIIDPDAIALPSGAEGRPDGEPDWIKSLLPSSGSAPLSAEEIKKARRYYYGEVAFLDSQVGKLLDWMRSRNLLDNTIVVFVSDHGNHLGDYGFVQKQTFYEPVVKVPYIFWYPHKISGGVVIDTPVETRTLMPTLLELANLSVPAAIAGKTRSIAKTLVEGRDLRPRPVFSEFNLASFGIHPDDRLVMVRDGHWKLSLAFSPEAGDGTLHNIAADPYERVNLYDNPEHSDVQQRLATLIFDHLNLTAESPGMQR